MMRAATCFSGIGAPETAAPHFDWVWSAEVEPFPAAVLNARHPGSANLGDVLAPDFIERARMHGPIDLLMGGPPCQAFSVAGLRNSLADARGNLSLRWVQLIHAIGPLVSVTENVPGWLSTKDNAFGCFLGALAGADDPLHTPDGAGWTNAGMVAGPLMRIAWRVLDAQYFGVPQRRRRVFVVASPPGGICPASVLFEPASLRGDSPPGREAGEGVAATLTAGSPGGSGYRNDPDTSENLVVHSLRAAGFDASEDGTGRGTPLVAVAFMPNDPGSHIDGVAPAQRAGSGGGSLGSRACVAFTCKDHGVDAGETAPTLRAMGHSGSHANAGGQVAIAFHENQRGELTINDTAGSLKTGGGKPGQGYPAMMSGAAVRRLMPVECERLQGLPDHYTAISYRGKPAADGPRYKAIGNSMAVPVVQWILTKLEKITAQLQLGSAA